MKKNIIYYCRIIVKSSIKAFIMTLLIFFPLFIIVACVFGDRQEQFSEPLLRLICMVTYIISFYFSREKERYELFSCNEKFNFLDEGKIFFAKEGIYILSIYSVVALLGEIYSLITAYNAKNPIAFLCTWCLPFYSAINIPILRSVISILLAGFIHLMIVEFNSYKISKKKKEIS